MAGEESKTGEAQTTKKKTAKKKAKKKTKKKTTTKKKKTSKKKTKKKTAKKKAKKKTSKKAGGKKTNPNKKKSDADIRSEWKAAGIAHKDFVAWVEALKEGGIKYGQIAKALGTQTAALGNWRKLVSVPRADSLETIKAMMQASPTAESWGQPRKPKANQPSQTASAPASEEEAAGIQGAIKALSDLVDAVEYTSEVMKSAKDKRMGKMAAAYLTQQVDAAKAEIRRLKRL